MLQQTTVQAVIPYYERWMARFPTAHSLAIADEGEVLAYWAGLGYYSRSRRLHAAARWSQHHGWPDSVEGWLGVPGVGPYTAAAVASISQGLPVALVDGNVERCFARLNAETASGGQLKRLAQQWADRNIVKERPGDWNQALMELGAVICRPKGPNCGECPVQVDCMAFFTGKPETFPTPKARPATIDLAHSIWIPCSDGKFGITQTPVGQWWAGLWGFPRTLDAMVPPEFHHRCLMEQLGRFKHSVTNHRISVVVHFVSCPIEIESLLWVTRDELDNYGLPSPQRRALALFDGTNGQPALLYRDGEKIINHEKNNEV